MKKLSCLFTLLLLLSTLSSFAQTFHNKMNADKKALKYLNEAQAFLNVQKNSEALAPLQKAVAEDPLFIDAHLLLGELYANLGQYAEAKAEISAGINLFPNHSYNSNGWYLLSKICWALDDYDGSLEAATEYLAIPGIPKERAEEIKRYAGNATFAKDAIAHQVPFNPINLGDSINTSLMEYFPSVSGDEQTLVFTRRVKAGGGYQEDFYVSYFKEGKWSRARNMGEPVNTLGNEGAQSLSASGTLLFFTGCDRPGGRGSCDIYFSAKINGQWTLPRNAGSPVNSVSWDSQPTISADGKALYFISSRLGGLGGQDIWVSYKNEQGKWGEPKNLGMEINTPYNEETPFIHPDNQTLYFSSKGHEGFGGSDIFMSRRKADGSWDKAVNLGYPLNSKGDEIGFIVSLDGKHAYFSSDKVKKDGNLDLYVCDVFEAIKPKIVTYLEGFISNAVSGEMLGADVQLLDLETGTVINSFSSDPTTGYYMVSIPAGKNYALNVSKKDFLFHSENFSLKDSSPDKPYHLDVKLQPVKVGESVVLKNIFFETNASVLKDESKVELNKLIGFMKENAALKIQIGGHTDNVGTNEANQKLSEARAKSVYDYLIANGVALARLTFKGFGEIKPIADNATEEGRAQNRRTEFTVLSMQ